MRLYLTLLVAVLFATAAHTFAQPSRRAAPRKAAPAPAKPRLIGQTAFVMDETLSVLRPKPSLFAVPLQRLRRGRAVKIQGVAEADGVTFYKITAMPGTAGWLQADSVFGKFEKGSDARLASLVQSMSGFDQIEAAVEFFNIFPDSQFRKPLLLLVGDLLEEVAAKLSRDATRALNRREMAATAAPLHSYYLNFVSLDRYRRLGLTFLFNPETRQFHYDGVSWKEIVAKYPDTDTALEARKRLESLSEKMGRKAEASR